MISWNDGLRRPSSSSGEQHDPEMMPRNIHRRMFFGNTRRRLCINNIYAILRGIWKSPVAPRLKKPTTVKKLSLKSPQILRHGPRAGKFSAPLLPTV
jgi:hypothetical protein